MNPAMMTLEKEILQRFEGFSPEVARALAIGNDFVVDIPSIKYLNKGFRFYSKNQLPLDELLKFEIKSRWIAVVGDYNTGKTFFSCLMMGRPFASDLVIRTPGITIMLSPKEEEENLQIRGPLKKPEALVKEVHLLRIRARKATSPEERDSIQATIKEKEEHWKLQSEHAFIPPRENTSTHQCDFAIFDTAGDDRPCSFVDHPEVRATEMVTRAVIVQTAQTMIFVTSKFDRDSQEKLSCLMSQMARQRKPASRTNRIIVIHNGIEATDRNVHQNFIYVSTTMPDLNTL